MEQNKFQTSTKYFFSIALLIIINIISFSIIFSKYQRTKMDLLLLKNEISSKKNKLDQDQNLIVKKETKVTDENVLTKDKAQIAFKKSDVSVRFENENQLSSLDEVLEDNLNLRKRKSTNKNNERNVYKSNKTHNTNFTNSTITDQPQTNSTLTTNVTTSSSNHTDKDTLVSDIGQNIHGGLTPMVTTSNQIFMAKINTDLTTGFSEADAGR